MFDLDDELLFNDEFDNITLNLDDKLLNAAYDIRYNCPEARFAGRGEVFYPRGRGSLG